MSKVLWVFIQSFKIRGKEKKKNHIVLLNVFHMVFWFVFFFVLGTQNGALAEQFTDFHMGKGKGSMIWRLPRSTAELKN